MTQVEPMDVSPNEGSSANPKEAWVSETSPPDESPTSDLPKREMSGVLSNRNLAKKHKLGTFKGVFVPTLQNILGIILFLRLPKITGHAGIGGGLAIVLMSCMATFLTSLSMSAVATNGVPKGGGCYSIIKESIGPEFGGTVGLLLFFSNNFGVAMYVIGFVEILDMIGVLDGMDFGEKLNTYRIIGTATLLCLFSIVFVGIKYIARFAVLFLSIVGTAILCIYLGVIDKAVNPTDDITGFPSQLVDNFTPKYGQDEDGNDYSFAILLAIFFPAVTDPLAGSNLSGDLENPQKSIPPGTLIAVLVTTLIFSLQVIFTGGSCDRDYLRFDTGGTVVSELAWPVKQIIYMGMMTSTLGAGLQSLAGAPRLLAAIANDRLIPQLAIFGPKNGGEPRLALCLCGCFSLCCIMLGRLELVAPFITMWFLACYAVINGAAAYLGREDAIHFRPRFKWYNWKLSLLGMLQCAGMMFFIDPMVAAIAIAIGFCIYKYIQRTLGQVNKKDSSEERSKWSLPSKSGTKDLLDESKNVVKTDWQAGRRFTNVRSSLLAVEEGDFQYKYWRPFILYLTGIDDEQDKRSHSLLDIVGQLQKRGKGLSIVGGVVPGEYRDTVEKVAAVVPEMKSAMQQKGVDGFPEIISASNVYEGYRFLIQGTGMGVLRPNTVMMSWPADVSTMDSMAADNYVDFVGDVKSAGKTLLLARGKRGFRWPDDSMVIATTIDVWWIFDLFPADGLLLVFPFLLLQHNVWAGCKMRIFIVTPPEAAHGVEKDRLKKTVEEFLDAGGVLAAVNVIIMTEDEAPRFAAGSPTSPRSPLRKDPSALSVDSSMANETSLPKPGDVNIEQKLERHATNSDGEREEIVLDKCPEGKRRSVWAERDAHGSRLTHVMAKESGESDLVFITLPPMQAQGEDDQFSASKWLQSVDTLVLNLRRVVFIQASGTERVQFFA